ncbi:MAG: hypothetical protein ACYTBX_01735 [Planctomycetota bacterium]
MKFTGILENWDFSGFLGSFLWEGWFLGQQRVSACHYVQYGQDRKEKNAKKCVKIRQKLTKIGKKARFFSKNE